MALPQGFQAAKLKIDAPVSEELTCGFNPQSFSVAKTNVFTFKPTQGQDLPKGEFGGGLPRVTKLNLLLDGTLPNPNNRKTVSDQANLLLKMMETNGGAAPPMVQFIWGAVNLPKAFPINLTIQYILFKPNGEPIRATCDIELAQAEKATTASGGTANAGTNPTTRAKRRTSMHVVHDGDSLPSIAYRAYGDATRWREIAIANDIDDPMILRRGSALTIPRGEELW